MMLREQDKHFLWSLYSAVTIILLWKGVWEGLYYLPLIGHEDTAPWIFLFIGLTMLTLSGVIFKEFDPFGGVGKAVNKIVQHIQNHPHKDRFQLRYYDKQKKEHLQVNASKLMRLEKGALILKLSPQKQEVFIPTHRLTEVLYQGKIYWKL